MTSSGHYGAFVLYVSLVGLLCWMLEPTAMPGW